MTKSCVEQKNISFISLQFMSLSELSDSLKQISVLQDAPAELFDALAVELYPDLTR